MTCEASTASEYASGPADTAEPVVAASTELDGVFTGAELALGLDGIGGATDGVGGTGIGGTSMPGSTRPVFPAEADDSGLNTGIGGGDCGCDVCTVVAGGTCAAGGGAAGAATGGTGGACVGGGGVTGIDAGCSGSLG